MPLDSCVLSVTGVRAAPLLTSPFQDTELEDDDDGSTTVTNSTVNLTHLVPRPAPVPAEDLAAKLESITAAPIEEAKSLPASLVEEPSDLEPTAGLPSDDERATDLGTANQDLVMEETSV